MKGVVQLIALLVVLDGVPLVFSSGDVAQPEDDAPEPWRKYLELEDDINADTMPTDPELLMIMYRMDKWNEDHGLPTYCENPIGRVKQNLTDVFLRIKNYVPPPESTPQIDNGSHPNVQEYEHVDEVPGQDFMGQDCNPYIPSGWNVCECDRSDSAYCVNALIHYQVQHGHVEVWNVGGAGDESVHFWPGTLHRRSFWDCQCVR